MLDQTRYLGRIGLVACVGVACWAWWLPPVHTLHDPFLLFMVLTGLAAMVGAVRDRAKMLPALLFTEAGIIVFSLMGTASSRSPRLRLLPSLWERWNDYLLTRCLMGAIAGAIFGVVYMTIRARIVPAQGETDQQPLATVQNHARVDRESTNPYQAPASLKE